MKTTTAINYIHTNSFVDTNFKPAIFKTDIFDHFLSSPKVKSERETTSIYIRIVNTLAIRMFKQQLYEIDWKEIKRNQNPYEAYNIFIQKFLLYTTITFRKKRQMLQKKTSKVLG